MKSNRVEEYPAESLPHRPSTQYHSRTFVSADPYSHDDGGDRPECRRLVHQSVTSRDYLGIKAARSSPPCVRLPTPRAISNPPTLRRKVVLKHMLAPVPKRPATHGYRGVFGWFSLSSKTRWVNPLLNPPYSSNQNWAEVSSSIGRTRPVTHATSSVRLKPLTKLNQPVAIDHDAHRSGNRQSSPWATIIPLLSAR